MTTAAPAVMSCDELMEALERAAAKIPEGSIDLLLDGDKQPVEGSCTSPFVWGPDPGEHFRQRPAEMRLGVRSARGGLYWLLPARSPFLLCVHPVKMPDRVLARIVATIDAGEAVVVRGWSRGALNSITEMALPMCGGWNA